MVVLLAFFLYPFQFLSILLELKMALNSSCSLTTAEKISWKSHGAYSTSKTHYELQISFPELQLWCAWASSLCLGATESLIAWVYQEFLTDWSAKLTDFISAKPLNSVGINGPWEELRSVQKIPQKIPHVFVPIWTFHCIEQHPWEWMWLGC